MEEIRKCDTCGGRAAKGWKGSTREGACRCKKLRPAHDCGRRLEPSEWAAGVPRGVNKRVFRLKKMMTKKQRRQAKREKKALVIRTVWPA